MKNFIIGVCVALLCALAACGPQNEADDTNNLSTEASADSEVKREEVEPGDSTLQVLEEVTLHALGNSQEEIKFDQDTLDLKTGAKVSLKLINEGTEQSMIHNVVITVEGKSQAIALAGAAVGASGNYVPKSPEVIASSPLALPGQTVEIQFSTPVDSVSYDFICTYPDHHHTGVGKIRVR